MPVSEKPENKELALEVSSLSVSYGRFMALDNFNLTAQSHEGIAILGLNGAGKTSALRAILGMLPYQGNVRWFGSNKFNPHQFTRIGYAPEEASPPEFLTGEEYLSFIARFRISEKEKQKNEVSIWLDAFELSPHKRISDYSKGMRRRLILAQALLASPPLVILDEPLNGLDPILIMKLRELLFRYREGGGTLLYSSHILSEVEKGCSKTVILRRGKITADTTIEKLISEYGSVEKAFAKLASSEGHEKEHENA